jgi:hypothetical protein
MNQNIGTSSMDLLWACTPAVFKKEILMFLPDITRKQKELSQPIR